jgi:hypothetical protein
VVERGRRTLLWRIEWRDGWRRAEDWPNAELEHVDPGPGTVWERRIRIRVPRGTRLERVISRPGKPVRRDAWDYLAREVRGPARAVTRTRFEVAAHGELVAVESGRGTRRRS